MRRVIDSVDIRGLVDSEDGSLMVELDGSVSSASSLWQMVLAMAMQDRAWCIQYDVQHPLRLLYVTSCSVYGLVPPPDEMAETMIRAIDRITMSTSAIGQLFSTIRALLGGRITRSFAVKHQGETVGWVARWPRRANDGPILLFRESYPGWDPSAKPVDEPALRREDERVRQSLADLGHDVSDRDRDTR